MRDPMQATGGMWWLMMGGERGQDPGATSKGTRAFNTVTLVKQSPGVESAQVPSPLTPAFPPSLCR